MAYDTHAPLFWESGPPPTFAHMPLPKSSRARLSPSICVISKLRIGLTNLLSPLTQLSGFFFCFWGAWQVVDGTFQVGSFAPGRCDRRGKSGGPPLLKLSLKVKGNSAHSQSSAPSPDLNARGRLKVRLGLTSGLSRLAQGPSRARSMPGS